MKIRQTLLAFLSTTLGFLTTSNADYAAEVIADAPLAYYRFEEAVGATTLADSSGNGLAIDYSAPVGSTQLGEDGAVGQAILFNGDEGILTPLNFDPASGDFTIEAIVSPTQIDSEMVYVSNQDGTTGPGRSNMIIQTGTGTVRWRA